MEQKKDKLAILVCAHKKDPYTRNEGVYKAIQVGKALHPELDLGYINDNEGENVSDKNPKWCELSAIYWGWKNLNNVEYAGLCHYRRYFDIDITDNNIDKILKNKDILLVKRTIENCNIATRFSELVSMEDFYIFLDALLEIHPEYKESVINYCYNSNRFIPCTMFLAKKSVYDDFCKTFFPVFFKIDSIMLTHGYSRLNRAIAYLGELSLGLYVTHNNLKAKYVPLKFCADTNVRQSETLLKKIKGSIRKTKRNIGFKLLNGKFTKLYRYDAVVAALKRDGIVTKHTDE